MAEVSTDVVLLFEIEGGRNVSGGPELMVDNKHDDSGSNILLTDFNVVFASKVHTKGLNLKRNQSKAASYSYDAYGVMLGGNPTPASPTATNMLYAGEQFDR